MSRQLQVNGLPIAGKFDEISTTDFSSEMKTFVLKPKENEILEFSAVKMEFDNKLDYKPITVKLFAHGIDSPVDKVQYNRIENWKHKSHYSSVDDYTFEDRKIVTYIREFSENVYLVADNLKQYMGKGGIEVMGLERVEISVHSSEPLTTKEGDPLKIVQGRYDAVRYVADDKDKGDWGLGVPIGQIPRT